MISIARVLILIWGWVTGLGALIVVVKGFPHNTQRTRLRRVIALVFGFGFGAAALALIFRWSFGVYPLLLAGFALVLDYPLAVRDWLKRPDRETVRSPVLRHAFSVAVGFGLVIAFMSGVLTMIYQWR